MTLATTLLLTIGLLGAIDIAYFHSYRGRLVLRPESRREAWIHVARGGCYTLQFLIVPNVRFTGAWFALFVLLFVFDIGIAAADVLEEPRARASQGGLCGGEYLMHIGLSVLVGAYLCSAFRAAAGWPFEPAAIRLCRLAPTPLRVLAALVAAGCALTSLIESLILIEQRLGTPAPLHVRVRLSAPIEQVWNLTQDHRLHPSWDHRFDRITMCHEDSGAHDGPPGTPDPRIRTGTLMRYEKRVLGVTIRGFGRYQLHRPTQQSTFAFWSDDPRSLIRRGAGLWRYTALPDGRTEFATSYTYEVRWGILGRVVDRFMFRPLFQRYTEQSFRRLARRYFAEPRPRVLGRDGRLPRRFEEAHA
jgi:hypothetical protein